MENLIVRFDFHNRHYLFSRICFIWLGYSEVCIHLCFICFCFLLDVAQIPFTPNRQYPFELHLYRRKKLVKYLHSILLNSCQTSILFAKENSTKTSYEDTQKLLSSSKSWGNLHNLEIVLDRPSPNSNSYLRNHKSHSQAGSAR